MVAVAASVAAAILPGAAAADTVLADNGFRPMTDGFSFPNYGPGAADLSAVEMQRIFGPGVCSSRRRGICVLTPPARAFLMELNDSMEGGHCYGFSVLALGLFKHQFRPLGLGGSFSYQLRNNIRLQRTIAYAFTQQALDSVNRRILAGTPNQVLTHIERVLAASRSPETYTLAIFKPDGTGGHAVTPFEVVDRGSGKVSVRIYDNNYPRESREIAFDTNANTWQYNAATNPAVEPDLYVGTAVAPGIKLMPTTPGLKVQPCPFCGRSRSGGEEAIRLTGDPRDHAHLLIRNRGGKRVGLVKGRLINEIPGARIEPAIEDDTTLRLEPTYVVPAQPATIAIDGRGLRHVDTETIDAIGPGHDVALRGLRIGPGQRDILRLRNGVQQLSFTTAPGQSGSPTLQIGANSTQSDYTLRLRMVRFPGGATLRVALDTRRQVLTVSSSARHARASVVLSVVRQTHAGKRSSGRVKLTLRGPRPVILNYSQRPTITPSF